MMVMYFITVYCFASFAELSPCMFAVRLPHVLTSSAMVLLYFLILSPPDFPSISLYRWGCYYTVGYFSVASGSFFTTWQPDWFLRPLAVSIIPSINDHFFTPRIGSNRDIFIRIRKRIHDIEVFSQLSLCRLYNLAADVAIAWPTLHHAYVSHLFAFPIFLLWRWRTSESCYTILLLRNIIEMAAMVLRHGMMMILLLLLGIGGGSQADGLESELTPKARPVYTHGDVRILQFPVKPKPRQFLFTYSKIQYGNIEEVFTIEEV